MSPLRRVVSFVLALFLAAAPAHATWSILIVDTRTGEIAVGSATCVAGFNLLAITPVLRVNRGAATAQATVVINSMTNRQIIWNGLQQNMSPSMILAALAAQDPGHQWRQYGIIDVTGAKVTFSGANNTQWAGGVVGSVGTIHYAIQGNILTGQPVVTAAEQAVRNTPGDLAEKLMAGMEAARAMGGDGRCSCTPSAPTSCGAPPPSFTKSAHIGYMVVARQGDIDGTCTSPSVGCASGTYYMKLNVANQNTPDPDPVLQLRSLFDAWRTTLNGRPDHHLSTVSLDPPTLIPDGAATATATVVLRDWQGTRLTTGGANVTVTVDPSSTAPVTVGAVQDRGDGSYTFPVTAGNVAGTARLRITVDDGQGRPVLLSPRTAIEVRADALWASTAALPAASGGAADFRLDAGSGAAGRIYALAGTLSGTVPGIPAGAVTVPLNPDPFFEASLLLANSAVFVNSVGSLDAQGRARARFAMPSGLFVPLAGTDLHFAYALLSPVDFASNPVRVGIEP